METGDAELVRIGLELLNRCFAELKDDSFNHADLHYHRGVGYEKLEDIPRALKSYREAVAAQRRTPNAHTYAWLRFGWLVVQRHLTDSFNEAEAMLSEFGSDMVWPVERFRFHAIRAAIASHTGDSATAHNEAKLALEAAAVRHSGMRYHASLGLVENVPDDLLRQLQLLAGNDDVIN